MERGDMEIKVHYNYSGVVLGNYWGGGRGAYASIKETEFDSIEKLLLSAEEHLKKGSLDSGMGYESLIGAILLIETVKSVTIGEDTFINKSTDDTFIGDLTEEQKDFLYECLYYGN
jgi:hypothetical protein